MVDEYAEIMEAYNEYNPPKKEKEWMNCLDISSI
jgi:hypothetical protein